MENENKNAYNAGGPWWKPAVEILGEVSSWIVVPIVLALIVGKMLDTHYGTKPVFFLSLAGIGFLITCLGIFKIMRTYIKKLKITEKEDLNK